MRIILVHFRVGEKDGVSLEMEKWKKALQVIGHEVTYMAGSLGKEEGFVLNSIKYVHPNNHRIHSQAFNSLTISEMDLKDEIISYSQQIEKKLGAYIKEWKPELLIVNNLWSLGHNLAAAIAFHNTTKHFGIKAISHNHDFYWERKRYAHPTCKFVEDILERYFPPDDPDVKHVVINKIAQIELEKRKKINAKVVPNVFDFDQKPWIKDNFNSDMRKKFGITEKDLVFLQATRIVERKAIELAIDLVAEFKNRCFSKLIGNQIYNGRKIENDSRMILFLAGSPEFDSFAYRDKLRDYARSENVELIFGYESIAGERELNHTKIYSLWDAYTMADVVTYPSIKEGWGNQFIEAIFAKLPVIIFEYPVFKSDIEPLGFWTMSLGDKYTVHNNFIAVDKKRADQTADELCDALLNKEKTLQMLERNFSIGKKHLSLEALSGYLKGLI